MLSHMMTATATTQRMEAMTDGKRGDLEAHLSGVKITPLMLPSAQGQHNIRQAIGIEGSAIQVWETYTEQHEHTDNGIVVNQVPDINKNDRLTVNGVTYVVRWSKSNPATFNFLATRIVYLTEDEIS